MCSALASVSTGGLATPSWTGDNDTLRTGTGDWRLGTGTGTGDGRLETEDCDHRLETGTGTVTEDKTGDG